MHRSRNQLPVPVLLAILFAAGCVSQGVQWNRVPLGVVVTPDVEILAEDGSFKLVSGKSFIPPFYTNDCLTKANTSNYARAEQMGARRVIVRVPGMDKPLHGILALCEVHPRATGPATRSYQIQVPAQYVEATAGGRVSVVYEITNYRDFDAWQLWLSRVPFPAGR
jgi:hypothetical protein